MRTIDKILIAFIVLPISFLYIRYKIKYSIRQYLKSEEKKELIEKQYTPKQKKENTTKQIKKHNLFISLSLGGSILILFLKNTFAGFFIGFGSLVLAFKVFFGLGEYWSKNKPYNKKIMLLSFILMIFILAVLTIFYDYQFGYFYDDR